jgi:DNA-binding transcriptional regulator YiaG
MKELRFDAADGVWRVAFAFDPNRKAILLACGDKSGGSEKRFYRQLIEKADTRFDGHLARIRREKEKQAKRPRQKEMKTLDQKIGELSPARRKKIEARAAQLVAEEKSLRELRRAHKLTQARIAETLGIGQDQVSRLEQRSDLLLSTLRGYVEAMGGRLTIVAEFPHQKPVVLSGIGALETETASPEK